MEMSDTYPVFLLGLATWREARGELLSAKQGVACSIRNRVLNPGWWGHDYVGCILMPWQYSSFNRNDPNATKFPLESDPSWRDCLDVAGETYFNTLTDPTSGADSYFDISLDHNPPSWATDGSKTKTCDIGRLHFYRTNARTK